jgi:hypothetical protein
LPPSIFIKYVDHRRNAPTQSAIVVGSVGLAQRSGYFPQVAFVLWDQIDPESEPPASSEAKRALQLEDVEDIVTDQRKKMVGS